MTDLDNLFLNAAETERKLPAAIRYQKLTSWPDYMDEWSAYGWEDFVPGIGSATAPEVTGFETALLLSIEHMNKDDRRLVWTVAHSAAFRQRGPKWAKLGRMMGGRDSRAVKRMYIDALVRCYYNVQGKYDPAPQIDF